MQCNGYRISPVRDNQGVIVEWAWTEELIDNCNCEECCDNIPEVQERPAPEFPSVTCGDDCDLVLNGDPTLGQTVIAYCCKKL